MQDYDHTIEKEDFINEKLNELNDINEQLKNLVLIKENLTQKIVSALNHNHEGQKTYDCGNWSIEVKTPYIYSFNKKLYEASDIRIPNKFNPVKESTSYSIDKRLCDKYINEAPKEIKEQLILLIEKKPGKASITIKENI